jgi:hypothetical protein
MYNEDGPARATVNEATAHTKTSSNRFFIIEFAFVGEG